MGAKSVTTLVVAAHPDDETVGAGIWLHRNAKSHVQILHVTDGSPRDMENAKAQGFPTWQAYASARRQELSEALALSGIPFENCVQFGFPDKEAHLNLTAIIDRLRLLVERLRPDMVLSSAYEGGHPDHDSVAFAVAAVRQMQGGFVHREFPLYHSSPDGALISGTFLPGGGASPEEVLALSEGERELKAKMFQCFRTQSEILSRLTVGFEPFRTAPAYNFAAAPHPGPLLYERWGWGISGVEWRAQAEKALS